jgi:hypothetical protein
MFVISNLEETNAQIGRECGHNLEVTRLMHLQVLAK